MQGCSNLLFLPHFWSQKAFKKAWAEGFNSLLVMSYRSLCLKIPSTQISMAAPDTFNVTVLFLQLFMHYGSQAHLFSVICGLGSFFVVVVVIKKNILCVFDKHKGGNHAMFFVGQPLTDGQQGQSQTLEPSTVQGQGYVKGRGLKTKCPVERNKSTNGKQKQPCPGLLETCRLQKPMGV